MEILSNQMTYAHLVIGEFEREMYIFRMINFDWYIILYKHLSSWSERILIVFTQIDYSNNLYTTMCNSLSDISICNAKYSLIKGNP